MAANTLKELVGRLDDTGRRTLEAAAGLTLSRTQETVEIEHWLLKLIDDEKSGVLTILDSYGLDRARVDAELLEVLNRLRSGHSGSPSLSMTVVDILRVAGTLADGQGGGRMRVRGEHVLAAALSHPVVGPGLREACPELVLIPSETLLKRFEPNEEAVAAQAAAPAGNAAAAPAPSADSALGKFTIDLTARARAGKIDPVLGRDGEIRQVIDILTRRRQNNPILTGEAGVGKTAVVEGFALRVAAGTVPDALKPVAVHTLDLGLLQAGAGIRGEFENRLRGVIDEVGASPHPIILFVDEAHTLIGSGGQAGQGDAANLLKPALARGELRTIAATTWGEYKKYFERDAALARRFQVVKVEEPEEDAAIAMMRGLVPTLEAHHGVRILEEAVIDSVRLSRRYITGRQLPDKAISVLDTACARVMMGQTTLPSPIEDRRHRAEALDAEIAALAREQLAGNDCAERLADLRQDRNAITLELGTLEARWEQERGLVDHIRTLRAELELSGLDTPDPASQAKLAALCAELLALQGEEPLVSPAVDAQAVADIVASWTGIPVRRMLSDEIQAVLTLKDRMAERIIGQDEALESIARAMRTARAGLADPRKPLACFLMVGTSGVGKTETALALADLLYGGEQSLTVINMSEFKEEHKVSLLMGSPPGYVGYGEGGVLTEAVRRRPYGVLLLDEIEKANPGVQDVFYQVLDKGMLRDGEGREIDFRNTVIVMTSNAGTQTLSALEEMGPEQRAEVDVVEALRPELLHHFKPAFLGRVTVIPYMPLSDEVLVRIVALQLDRVVDRVASVYGATLTYDAALIGQLAERCREVDSGARAVERIIAGGLLPELAGYFLGRAHDGKASVHLAATAAGFSLTER